MFELVDRVELYPQFLPVVRGRARPRDERATARPRASTSTITASRAHFTTENVEPRRRNRSSSRSRTGLFAGCTANGASSRSADAACRVEFELAWEFATPLLERAVGPVFGHIANTFIDAFVRRAEALSRGEPVNVTVVWAAPGVQDMVPVDAAGRRHRRRCRRALADSSSDYGTRCRRLRFAVFGKRAAADAALADGDRVEISRPLVADPKESRRRRARSQPPSKSAPKARRRAVAEALRLLDPGGSSDNAADA